MIKNFYKGVAIGFLSIATLEVFNRIVNEKAKKFKLNINEGYYYTWKEGAVHYNVKGKGPAVLLVHDLSVLSSSHEWKMIEDELAANHTVYSIDLIGCGLSDKPDITYTAYTFVQLISNFCEEIIKEKCDVIASKDSASIIIMTQYMEELFNKIILINPAMIDKMPLRTTRMKLFEKRLLYTPIFGATIYNCMVTEERIKDKLEAHIFNADVVDEITEACYEASHLNHSKGRFLYACKTTSYVSCDITDVLPKVKNIYLVKGDQQTNYVIDEYMSINKNIEVVSISDSSIVPHYENPNETLIEIKKIID